MNPAEVPSVIEFSDRAVPPGIRPSLEAYAALLLEWNRAYNLIGPGAARTIWTHHILDSLAIAGLLEGSPVADIGSGAGFPGIVLAIACPDRRFVLIDANGKKTRFLERVKRALGLTHLDIVQARAGEDLSISLGSQMTLVSRALGSIAYFLEVSAPLATPGAQWLAMKGRIPHEELESLPEGYRVERLWQVRIEGIHAERHVIDLRQTDPAKPAP